MDSGTRALFFRPLFHRCETPLSINIIFYFLRPPGPLAALPPWAAKGPGPVATSVSDSSMFSVRYIESSSAGKPAEGGHDVPGPRRNPKRRLLRKSAKAGIVGYESDHRHFRTGCGWHATLAVAGRVAQFQLKVTATIEPAAEKNRRPTEEAALAALRQLRQMGTSEVDSATLSLGNVKSA